jgi:soluble lytic murein transglycosylase-like protein
MYRHRLRCRPAFAIAAALALTAAVAEPAHAGRCITAIERAAQLEGVPVSVLKAISQVEAGVRHAGRVYLWPWAVNDEGESYYFRDQASALRHVRQQLEAGRTNLDLGCMQINWHWHGQAFGDPGYALDPAVNARYGARYLRQLYKERGTWSGAVAAYHSRQPKRAGAYQCRVATALRPGRDIPGC